MRNVAEKVSMSGLVVALTLAVAGLIAFMWGFSDLAKVLAKLAGTVGGVCIVVGIGSDILSYIWRRK